MNNNTLPTWTFENEHLIFNLVSYQHGGGIAVEVLNKTIDEDGTEEYESYAIISVNMVDAPTLPRGQFYLKDWSENKKLATAMIAAGIIKEIVPSVSVRSGFVTTRAYQFTSEGKQYCMQYRFALFVPISDATPIAQQVVRGSAILAYNGSEVTSPNQVVSVDYEGNVHGAINMKTLADRAQHAADRQFIHYPTVARRDVARGDLLHIGWFVDGNGITLLNNDEARYALASWLGVKRIEETELRLSREQ